ncbi:hypothetical protein [Roseibium sp.]|uniref:hypothetical protein n=1 Tax=Roseibium sp. TaxID=1936156 RepID=UPI0039EE5159
MNDREYVGPIEGNARVYGDQVSRAQLLVVADMTDPAGTNQRFTKTGQKSKLTIGFFKSAKVKLNVEMVVFVAFPFIDKRKKRFLKSHSVVLDIRFIKSVEISLETLVALFQEIINQKCNMWKIRQMKQILESVG